ncbi:MAG TPA: hypothetical protein VGM86_30665 [Thermoanaerobaculia bacterium]|jgi:hypothetical protein
MKQFRVFRVAALFGMTGLLLSCMAGAPGVSAHNLEDEAYKWQNADRKAFLVTLTADELFPPREIVDVPGAMGGGLAYGFYLPSEILPRVRESYAEVRAREELQYYGQKSQESSSPAAVKFWNSVRLGSLLGSQSDRDLDADIIVKLFPVDWRRAFGHDVGSQEAFLQVDQFSWTTTHEERDFAARFVRSNLFSTNKALHLDPKSQPMSDLTDSLLSIVGILSDGPKGKVRNAHFVVDDMAPFLMLEVADRESQSIAISSGLARALITNCVDSLGMVRKMVIARRDCPSLKTQGINVPHQGGLPLLQTSDTSRELRDLCFYEPQEPEQLARAVESYHSCLELSAYFVLAHELAHIYLGHTISSIQNELEADLCARVTMGNALGGEVNDGGKFNMLFDAIRTDGAQYWDLNGEQLNEIETRRQALNEPLPKNASVTCLISKD